MEKFHISDILTVMSGKMVSIRNMDGLYAILNYMCNDNLFTHQIVRCMQECRPYLEKQFPQFRAINVDDLTDSNHFERMKAIEIQYGAYHEVEALPEGAHDYKDAVVELIEIHNK